MKKNITKDMIVKTSLELIRNKNELRGLNLREVARHLGCAHTNIYNHFISYTDLLWEAHSVLLEDFIGILNERLKFVSTAESKLTRFFDTFADIYLNNKGWFRLAWLEHIGGIRPERNKYATEQTYEKLTEYITGIWLELNGILPDKERIGQVLHNTHCYIVGEISNHIAGRGIMENEDDLRDYIVLQAVNIMTLSLGEG